MRKYVEAVYENGRLRLLEQLPLKEGERITVTVHLDPPDYSHLFDGVTQHQPQQKQKNNKGPRLVKMPNPRCT